MILYSVTVSIDLEVENDWIEWMQQKHIPDVMNTGYFSANELRRLLQPVPEPGAATYNIQYTCATMDDLLLYQEKEAPGLQEEHTERYKDRFVAFRTILERI